MTQQDENSEERKQPKKYMRLNYYGGTTSIGALPRDPNWLKEIMRFLGLRKTKPADEPDAEKLKVDY